MNVIISSYPQAVVLNGRVYIGGGRATSYSMSESTVMICYDIEHNQWTALPPFAYMYFAMAEINKNSLVLVGG